MALWIRRSTYPSAVTVVTTIRSDRVDDLRILLNKLQILGRLKNDTVFPALKAVHYARWVILEADTEADANYPAALVYSCITDSGPKAHFTDLMTVEGGEAVVREIYSNCEVPFDKTTAVPDIVRYLTRRNISSVAGFKARRSHTVQQILDEDELYQSIQGFLSDKAKTGEWKGRPAGDVRREIQRHVVITPRLEWARKPEPTTIVTDFLRGHFGLYVAFLALFWVTLTCIPGIAAYFLIHPINDLGDDHDWFFFLWWLVAVPVLFWFIIFRITVLRIEESFESGGYYPSEKKAEWYQKHVKKLEDSEDWGPQNPMSLVMTVKTSPLRIANLKFVMQGTKFACKYLLFHGNLGGIVSIHFADWVFINRDRRILFFSNYDGSWEGYLGEFLEGRALKGFNAIYSNTRGYPRTTFLVGKGARRQARMFKELVRERARVTDFWYARYPYLSVPNILINSTVRQGLWGRMSEDDCAKWLHNF